MHRCFSRDLIPVLLCAWLGLMAGETIQAAVVDCSPGVPSGIPLGGIGTGGVEIRPDGLFHSWNLFNNSPWAGGNQSGESSGYLPSPPEFLPLDACFGVRILGKEPPAKVRLLYLNGGSDGSAVAAADRLYRFPWLGTVESIEFDGRYPFATLNYRDPGLPCEISLEAMSPFIPHNPEDSALPACLFRFRIHNPTDETMAVSVFFSLLNGVGYDQPSRIVEHRVYRNAGRLELVMGARDLPPSPTAGELALASLGEAASVKTAWSEVGELLWDFRDDGFLSGPESFTSEPRQASGDPGKKWRGSLADRLILRPGQTDSTTFLLAWHFPHQLDADRRAVGHHYTRRFDDVRAVIDYLAPELPRLHGESRRFTDTLYRSTLPAEVVEAVNASLTAFARSTIWTAEGDFAMWEGLGGRGLNGLDVSYYGSWPTLALFPELEKTTLVRLGGYQDDRGRMPRFFPGTFGRTGSYDRVDIIPKFVLQVCRDFLWTGDRAFLDELWSAVQRGLDHVNSLDSDGNGLPNLTEEGDEGGVVSAERSPTGDSVYLGSIYLAALQAVIVVADKMDDRRASRKYGRLFRRARTAFDSYLWNEETGYYVASYDLSSGKRDSGCLAGQLAGQWYADLLGLGDLSNGRRITDALRTVHSLNLKPDVGLLNVVYPGKTSAATEIDRLPQTPRAGVEFAMAALMIGRGLAPQGLQIAREAYNRHRRAGLYWNLVERFSHHQRPMSVWTVMLALEGLRYDAVAAELRIAPMYQPEDFAGPLVLPGAWGSVGRKADADEQRVEITLTAGRLPLSQLTVPRTGSDGPELVDVTLDGVPLTIRWQPASDDAELLRILLPENFSLAAGRRLVIESK
ncbi:GH116 family glycosyl-hydrolase [candidate division KSB1 bacterium]